MTYQMEGNFTGNLMQPFLASLEVTQKFKIVKIGQNLTVKLSTKLKEVVRGIECNHF